MTRILNIVLLAVLALVISCTRTPYQEVQVQKEKERERLQQIIHTLSYIRDTRTGLCFAYTWAGPSNGGPAFTYVPCEGLEPYLISTSGPLK